MKITALLALVFLIPSIVLSQIKKETFTYSDTLKLDFYSSVEVKNNKRPLILLVHGGGFSGGKRDNIQETKFAQNLAERGYAVASMSYRLTRKGKSFGCDCPTEEKLNTFVATSEDITAAISFLNSRSEALRFDPAMVVLAGSSAGAEGVLNTAFMYDHPRFNHIRKIPVAAVISMAGAVVDANYLNQENVIPVLMFHGKKDKLVPYGSAPHHYCAQDAPGYLMLDGSETLSKKIRSLDGSYVFAYDLQGNHDWAGLAYDHIALISWFIDQTVVYKLKVQSEMEIQPIKKIAE